MEGFMEAKSDGRVGRCRVRSSFPFPKENPLRLLLRMWVTVRRLGHKSLAPARLPLILHHLGPVKAWPFLQERFLKRQKHIAD